MEQKKETVVYTYGVFDLLHVGHLQLLQEAKALGTKLIVGLFTDEVSKGFKRQPIIPLDQRIEMLKALRFVDEVVSQDELAPDTNLKKYKPDIVRFQTPMSLGVHAILVARLLNLPLIGTFHTFFGNTYLSRK